MVQISDIDLTCRYGDGDGDEDSFKRNNDTPKDPETKQEIELCTILPKSRTCTSKCQERSFIGNNNDPNE